MAIDFDAADSALRYAMMQGVKFADVRLEQSTSTGFLMKNGVVQISSFEDLSGIGIRVLINGTAGFAGTDDLSREGLKRVVSAAVKDAKACSRIDNRVKLSKAEAYEAKYEVRQKEKLEEVDLKARLDILQDIDKAVLSTGVKAPYRFLSISDSVDEKYYANSEGSKIFSRIPRVNFYYFLTVLRSGKASQRYWQYGKASGFEGYESFSLPATLSNDALAMDRSLKNAVRTPNGKLDVVVGPQITGIIVHESGGHPCEADRILGREAAQAGESFLSRDSIGSVIGSKHVSIIDDPTIPESFGFYLYDDEGIKASKKYLMKNGKIAGFLHSRETAASMNVAPNASGRSKGFDREPIARMSNTVIEPGDFSEDELIEGVRNGVFMKNFTEWNIDDRRVNQKYVGSEAYLIRNGKLGKPVSNPTIEITTQALYSSVDAVGNNVEYHSGTCGKGEPMQALPVWFGGPSMRLRGIKLK